MVGFRRSMSCWIVQGRRSTLAIGRRRWPPVSDPEDVLLFFDDLLGIADPNVALPRIDPDARRRRLTALVNTGCWFPFRCRYSEDKSGRPLVYRL